MRTKATVEDYQGSSSLGDVYGDPVVVKGRFEGKRRLVKRPDGSEIICSGTFTVRPDVTVAMKSRVTIAGRAYTVEEVLPAEGLARTDHIDLLLS